jgi:capsular exopolysaccharide synthesis family protein
LRATRLDGRILVVTSLDMMEGKTTILTNLGVVAAERRQRVLLIDADLRRPRLHEVFQLPNEYGLTDALNRPADVLRLSDLVQPTTTPGLWVLTSGPVNEASSIQMHTRDLHPLLERCRREYDFVLIDTPPLMLYSDARILGRQSDGVVMVVRANTRSHEELRSAYSRMQQDQVPVLGTILNDWKMDVDQSRAYGRYRDHYSMHA